MGSATRRATVSRVGRQTARRRVAWSLGPCSFERLPATIRQREDQHGGEQEEGRRCAQREPEPDTRQAPERPDRGRSERAERPPQVVARALTRRADLGRIELREEAAEHAEVAVAEVAEQRAQYEQRD